MELSIVGVNAGYPRLRIWEPLGVAPLAVVAVDSPLGIVPGCGQRPGSPFDA